ncbi:MAG TPA: hypothetical protein PKN96_10700 [Flavobacterium sp.]|uniref:hypothetical protein n=1 Tax=Flavobacterium sp. TaxID=239 RepID=UPI002BDCE7B4|nr:hypothetical protein [Flavobacterium sp.]HNP33750.1 hypothetical protein [Flavobacterium sp.]
MKKITPIVCLILVALSFNGCTSDFTYDENTALMTQLIGKWKYTEYHDDALPANIPAVDGYEIEFKADKTFTSNEVGGYNYGSYTILESQGNNLRLIYQRSWDAKKLYKYINSVDANHIYLQASSTEPTPEGQVFTSYFILTRVP